jgi:hypothetical protein
MDAQRWHDTVAAFVAADPNCTLIDTVGSRRDPAGQAKLVLDQIDKMVTERAATQAALGFSALPRGGRHPRKVREATSPTYRRSSATVQIAVRSGPGPGAALNRPGFGGGPTCCGGSSHVTPSRTVLGCVSGRCGWSPKCGANYESDWAVLTAVAQKLGIGTAETLRKWFRPAQVDGGQRAGVSTDESAEWKRLRRANEI